MPIISTEYGVTSKSVFAAKFCGTSEIVLAAEF